MGIMLILLMFGWTTSGTKSFADERKVKQTQATVRFEEDPSQELPTDPLNPGQPIVPEGPGGGGTEGPLSIDFASNFHFGNARISPLKTVVHKAIAQDTNLGYRPLFVQVTDKTGKHQGWTLSVRQNGQFKNEERELAGAELSLTGGQLATVSQATDPSTVTEKFKLNPEGTGDSQVIVKANVDEGAGQYVYRFGDGTDLEEVKDTFGDLLYQTTSHVTLTIPAGSNVIKGNYETQLTWTLSNVPSSL